MATLLSALPKLVLPLAQRQVRLIHPSCPSMSAGDIVTAYKVAIPEKQTQDLPGLDKKIARACSAGPT